MSLFLDMKDGCEPVCGTSVSTTYLDTYNVAIPYFPILISGIHTTIMFNIHS